MANPKITKFGLDLEIVFCDDHLVIVNKPGGMTVNGNRNKTVENVLKNFNKNLSHSDALKSPVAAHRIDVPTKGLVILARTREALVKMNQIFKERQIQKEYLAVVHGMIAENLTLDKDIGEKASTTYVERLDHGPSKHFKHLSLVKLVPITGRTHQLRIHLADAGHPVVGEKEYIGETMTLKDKGLFLLSKRLEFNHPITQEHMEIVLDTPNRFTRLLEREQSYYEKSKLRS